MSPYTCLTDVYGRVSGLSGHDFEVSEASCSGIGMGPSEVGVLASNAGQRKKSLLFQYKRMADGSPDAEPVITSIAGGVRISVKHVAAIVCRTSRWADVTIEYDIGRVVDAGDGPPKECSQE